ncbi:transcriptional regulator with XRE-family HTH domain [Haloactinopolyspora alba]|uniref:Transcriptional regulator with XRE-family HTH domain n=1 Tax=Haloactinopolyspora alba TaxID=648780 RepID=A0A2P8D180_9ACTN|nr:helix-turn-helix domain-containing protein [Haloactinopolyspora alba]PSK90983.1 transcriptional regulator with XRE-family HTH domain [Haloactinopolyspora alba]
MNDGGSESTEEDFARVVGARLRALRKRRRLSLQAVEEKSGGRLRAVVVGSYERGDRVASIRRIAELAEFYGVPVDSLVSDGSGRSASSGEGKVVIDLDALRDAPPETERLAGFVSSIQRQRNDFTSRTLTIRAEDVSLAALLYEMSPDDFRDKLVAWGVLVSS